MLVVVRDTYETIFFLKISVHEVLSKRAVANQVVLPHPSDYPTPQEEHAVCD